MNLRQRRGWQDLYWIGALIAATTLIWCAAYNRWTAAAWNTPIVYGGDAWWGMASTKAMADGEIAPILPKYPNSFGAPFTANWNDYPSVEEAVSAWWALLARAFGLFTGTNIAVLSAHVFAALSFYAVCRYLRYDRAFSAGGSLLFAFSRYAFWRGLPHLGLVYYWQLPLGLLVIWWCVAKAAVVTSRRKLLWSLAIVASFAVQNVYYTGLLLQLLCLVSLYHLVRRAKWREIALPLALAAVAMFAFLLMNFDTFYSRLVDGPNPGTVSRSYENLERYALKPVELLVPAVHRLQWLQGLSKDAYYDHALFLGESGSAYLGLVGILGLLGIGWQGFRALANDQARNVPSHLWLIVWIFAYSIVGGFNGILGFRFQLFRGTNRYSIVILCVVLLFCVRGMTRVTRAWPLVARLALAIAVVTIGLLDQIPPTPSAEQIAGTANIVASDASAALTVERQLKPGAMLFQMPVIDFPESLPINQMSDYDHFRPFLYSHHLRYSFGSDKGRPRDNWQKDAERLGVPSLIAALESYGFSAAWINKSGYADRAASILDAFKTAGRTTLLLDSPAFACVALHPAARLTLPPEFSGGWYSLEGEREHNWRWSTGDAAIVLYNTDPVPKRVHVSFVIQTLAKRRLEIFADNRSIFDQPFDERHSSGRVDSDLNLLPGKNGIRFHTDAAGQIPGNGDPRSLAFNIQDFAVIAE
ncbi:MAG: hypothetical protein ABR526_07205 [Chthoniobacterales bacterium]